MCQERKTMMIRLNNDYSEGCHPSILLRLNEMNLEQNPGYGTDTHCAEAADAVRKAFACPDADVHFLVGGTQANMTVPRRFARMKPSSALTRGISTSTKRARWKARGISALRSKAATGASARAKSAWRRQCWMTMSMSRSLQWSTSPCPPSWARSTTARSCVIFT